MLTIAWIIAIFISGAWPLAVAWLICKVIIWICSAMGVDDIDIQAIAVVSMFGVLGVAGSYGAFALSNEPGQGTVSIIVTAFVFVLDYILIKEVLEKKNERKKVKKIKTYIESLEQILEAIEDLRDEENDLLDGMPDNLRYTRQNVRAAK